jgi:hydroxymethylbilane synthase
MNKQIKIASRESKLALWQAYFVQSLIVNKLDTACDIITMKTQGDIILDRPLNEIGGKALFMKELEVAIIKGKADIAVHSLKDVPYELPEGFKLVSFMPREDPRDAFVSNSYTSIDDLPIGAVVGTSSLRRKSQLLNYRNDLVIKNLRGNVQTRLSKLDNGDYDAIVLAGAGLIRLELHDRIAQYIPVEISLPAVGQGIVVIESLATDINVCDQMLKLNDNTSYIVAMAERSFNEELKGGCHVAIAAHATIDDELLSLEAMVSSDDGTRVLKKSMSGDINNPKELGKKLACLFIELGAYDILGSNS